MSIQTFKQFDAERRKTVARKYGIALAELNRLYKADHYEREWADYVLSSYEAGSAFTTRQWNLLPVYLQRRVLRTSRALKMPGNQIDPWKVAA